MQSHLAPLPSLLLSPTQARPSIYTFQGTKRKPSKVEIKVVGSIIKKFYLERVEWEKNGMSSLSFFFFLSFFVARIELGVRSVFWRTCVTRDI